MTDAPIPAPIVQPSESEGLLSRVEHELEELVHDGEHDAEVAAPVAQDVADVAEVVDPALAPEVTAVEDVAKDAAEVVEAVDPEKPVPSGPATIDSSVTQGNRVTTQAALTPNNPVAILTDKIKDHFAQVTPMLAEARATLDRIEAELNKLRVGL